MSWSWSSAAFCLKGARQTVHLLGGVLHDWGSSGPAPAVVYPWWLGGCNSWSHSVPSSQQHTVIHHTPIERCQDWDAEDNTHQQRCRWAYFMMLAQLQVQLRSLKMCTLRYLELGTTSAAAPLIGRGCIHSSWSPQSPRLSFPHWCRGGLLCTCLPTSCLNSNSSWENDPTKTPPTSIMKLRADSA